MFTANYVEIVVAHWFQNNQTIFRIPCHNMLVQFKLTLLFNPFFSNPSYTLQLVLAIYLAIKHFRYFLEGREFHIQTDHKPLIYALSSRLDHHSPRQIRHLDFISQFTSDLRYVPGSANTAADALSRSSANALQVNTSSPVVDFRELALAQTDDPELAKLLADSSLHFERVPLALSKGQEIICDVSTSIQRPYVPECFRQAIFDAFHNLSHPGIRATQRLVTNHFVWPSVNSDVRRWARSCLQCQRAEVHCHTVAPLYTFATPDARFDHVLWVPCLPPMVLCIFSPALTTSRGGQRLYLSRTGLPTRWPKHLFRHGFLYLVYPPLSPQTTEDSSNQTSLTQLLGTKHVRITSYHPIANALVKQFHRHLKSALKASPQPEHWTNTTIGAFGDPHLAQARPRL